MANLDTLPTELLLEIVTCFPETKLERFEAFKNLRLVNKRFRSFTTPFLFSTTNVKIDTKATAVEHSNALKLLSDISDTVQKLSLQLLDVSITWKILIFGARMDRLGRHIPRYSYCQGGEEKQMIWSKNLPPVIRSFTMLNSLTISSTPNSVLLSSFWQTLQSEKIHLKDLSIQWRIEPALLDYLASYSGIERLSITCAFPSGSRSDWDAPDRKLAIRFAKSVLPQHAISLTRLVVTGHDEGFWAFGSHNAHIYETCQRLEEWGVSMNSHDVGSNKLNSHRDVVKPCLELANRLQQLGSLTIYISRHPANRKMQAEGVFHQYHEKYTASLIREVIRSTEIQNPRTFWVYIYNGGSVESYFLGPEGRFLVYLMQ